MIAEKIYNLNSFKRQYEALFVLSVCDTIPQLVWEQDKQSLLRKIDWNNMLSIASMLCYSTDSQHLDAALRIAQTCLTQETCTENQKHASAVILNTLTNKPSIDLAKKKHYLHDNYKDNLPLTLKLQQYRTDFGQTIFIKDKLLFLNRFQKEVYEAHKNNETISISAPTSAGKSYILCNILLEELLDTNKNIVYLVPTRALISQIEADLKKLIKEYQIESSVNITTVPPQENIDENKSNVFVFTQERLHWFLIAQNNIPINLLVIDEAHKIEDGYRGILLQQKLEEIVQYNPSVKVYFSSPFTSNPEILLDNVLNNSKKDKVNTQFVAVNQNLIYATQYPSKLKEWQLHLCTIDKSILLGKLILQDRPTGEFHKTVHITERFSDGNGSLIYCNRAADAEKIALLLFNLLDTQTIHFDVNELIKLVKKTIHNNYSLVKVLQKGIAFHYGNMPLLTRNRKIIFGREN